MCALIIIPKCIQIFVLKSVKYLTASQVAFLNHQAPVCISNSRLALFKIYNLTGRPQV